jgi:hypothetical protein
MIAQDLYSTLLNVPGDFRVRAGSEVPALRAFVDRSLCIMKDNAVQEVSGGQHWETLVLKICSLQKASDWGQGNVQ